MDRLAFISLFLGLVSGTQWVELKATDPNIKTIRVTLGGHEVALMRQPPWHAAIDFGKSLEPGELVATAFNERNEEVARTSQWLNLPRPVAELQTVVHRDNKSIALLWRHREHAQPKRATITVDGKPVRVTKDYTASLPSLDPEQPHVIAAELRFADGQVARSEQIIRGGFSDETGTQLTAIAVTHPAECFAVDGKPVRTTIAETSDAIVVMVKDPDVSEVKKVKRKLEPISRHEMPFNRDTALLFVWPVASETRDTNEPLTKLFAQTGWKAASQGVPWLLTLGLPKRTFSLPRQYTDAVAVAGLKAMRSSRRRAVVLLLSKNEDESHYAPADVRHYLAAIGVPLFVWSLDGPRPDLADSWGSVDDISSHEKLSAAVGRVRQTLEQQHIVWVATDPVSALHVEECRK